MKKLLPLFFLLIIICYNGCGIDANEKLYRRQITVESNIMGFRIGSTYFDSTTVYPYIFEDLTIDNLSIGNSIIPIYPIQSTGFIKFKVFGGEGYYNPITLNIKDSLTIITPVDTLRIFITGFTFNKSY